MHTNVNMRPLPAPYSALCNAWRLLHLCLYYTIWTDKSALIQGNGDYAMWISESPEMKVSKSRPQNELLFHIKKKSIRREQHRQNRLMASPVPQNTRTFQHGQFELSELEHRCKWWSFAETVGTENETTETARQNINFIRNRGCNVMFLLTVQHINGQNQVTLCCPLHLTSLTHNWRQLKY